MHSISWKQVGTIPAIFQIRDFTLTKTIAVGTSIGAQTEGE
jgi:hypothetical protein